MTQPKPMTAMDHYNRGAEALAQAAGQRPKEAEYLLEVASIHAALGSLRLNIDRARWEGRMA